MPEEAVIADKHLSLSNVSGLYLTFPRQMGGKHQALEARKDIINIQNWKKDTNIKVEIVDISVQTIVTYKVPLNRSKSICCFLNTKS